VTITAIRDEEGRLTGFAKVTRDLTERKRDEEALRKAIADLRMANEELDRFASVAAHDMMDPLRTISGFAELLVETDPSPEDGRRFSQHILDSSLRLTAMLQGLLAYARAGGASAAESTAVDLATAVAQVQADLAMGISDRDVRVEVAVPEGAVVLTDPNDLRVVLQNLVTNAVKFSNGDAPVITVAAERRGDEWSISVRDNGPGIAPEHQARIFSAFERAGGGGAGYGLGLAICQRLVERHGGRIRVDSEPDHGTRFSFTLRAADREAGPAPGAPVVAGTG
jgi:signal transduction histidine kinase